MNNKNSLKNIIFVFTVLLTALFGFTARAADAGNNITLNINRDFDESARSRLSAVLVKSTPGLYFYIEEEWWDSQYPSKKSEILANLENLSNEFENNIRPNLNSAYGAEWSPGIDRDNRVAVLLHQMKKNVTGYFRSSDEYIKLQIPDSNEREMIYLSTDQIDKPQLKIFLAHEYVHLITFNQKDRLQGVQEEIWLNEARADYSSTILGYDNLYEGSNLQRRVMDFTQKPDDSLTGWQETKYDYAIASLFTHYLVDHYGINILEDSLKYKSVGIESINKALLDNGFKADFAQIFTDWIITMVVNDCSLNSKYCYLNQNLKNLRINPALVFLPITGRNSSLSITNFTENWSGSWQKIIGGNGNLKLKFSNSEYLNFKIPYLVFNKNNNYSVNFLKLNEFGEGEIEIENFSDKYNSLVIIPSLQAKVSEFDGAESNHSYTFTISTASVASGENQALIQQLLAQIDYLKKQIAALQQKNLVCAPINNNLYMGMPANSEVSCLQKVLKSEGQNIYPEGLVTGYFGNLTKSAVMRFQEKYKNEILTPVGLAQGTGFVGSLTRQKINQLM